MKPSIIITIIIALAITLYLSQAQKQATQQQLTPQVTTTKQTKPQIELSTKAVNANHKPAASDIEHHIDKQNQPLQVIKRISWKLKGDITKQLALLQQQAATGNPVANYQLAMNYKYCFYAPQNQQALEEKLQDAYEFADSSQTIDNLNSKYQYCQSVSNEQRKQYYQHLLIAANQGQVEAKEAIGNITERQYMEELISNETSIKQDRNEYIAERDKFIEQKLQLLAEAAQHGSIKALIKLANMQHSQNYGPNGYMKAYAYNQIILELTDDNQLHNRYSWYQNKLYDQLTEKELDQAQQITTTWLKQIRHNGTIYR